MKKNTVLENAASKTDKTNRILTIFIAAFVGMALILGIILGAVSIVKKNKAAVIYESVLMGKEEASFFATYYKMRYMSILSASGVSGVEDTQAFWNRLSAEENKTYGELLKEGAEEYIRQITVANYLFALPSSLSGTVLYQPSSSATLFPFSSTTSVSSVLIMRSFTCEYFDRCSSAYS